MVSPELCKLVRYFWPLVSYVPEMLQFCRVSSYSGHKVLILLLLQALDKDGRPLCVYCQNPYKTQMVSNETLTENPWSTRFCSKRCMQEYWVSTGRLFRLGLGAHSVPLVRIVKLDVHVLLIFRQNTTETTCDVRFMTQKEPFVKCATLIAETFVRESGDTSKSSSRVPFSCTG